MSATTPTPPTKQDITRIIEQIYAMRDLFQASFSLDETKMLESGEGFQAKGTTLSIWADKPGHEQDKKTLKEFDDNIKKILTQSQSAKPSSKRPLSDTRYITTAETIIPLVTSSARQKVNDKKTSTDLKQPNEIASLAAKNNYYQIVLKNVIAQYGAITDTQARLNALKNLEKSIDIQRKQIIDRFHAEGSAQKSTPTTIENRIKNDPGINAITNLLQELTEIIKKMQQKINEDAKKTEEEFQDSFINEPKTTLQKNVSTKSTTATDHISTQNLEPTSSGKNPEEAELFDLTQEVDQLENQKSTKYEVFKYLIAEMIRLETLRTKRKQGKKVENQLETKGSIDNKEPLGSASIDESVGNMDTVNAYLVDFLQQNLELSRYLKDHLQDLKSVAERFKIEAIEDAKNALGKREASKKRLPARFRDSRTKIINNLYIELDKMEKQAQSNTAPEFQAKLNLTRKMYLNLLQRTIKNLGFWTMMDDEFPNKLTEQFNKKTQTNPENIHYNQALVDKYKQVNQLQNALIIANDNVAFNRQLEEIIKYADLIIQKETERDFDTKTLENILQKLFKEFQEPFIQHLNKQINWLRDNGQLPSQLENDIALLDDLSLIHPHYLNFQKKLFEHFKNIQIKTLMDFAPQIMQETNLLAQTRIHVLTLAKPKPFSAEDLKQKQMFKVFENDCDQNLNHKINWLTAMDTLHQDNAAWEPFWSDKAQKKFNEIRKLPKSDPAYVQFDNDLDKLFQHAVAQFKSNEPTPRTVLPSASTTQKQSGKSNLTETQQKPPPKQPRL